MRYVSSTLTIYRLYSVKIYLFFNVFVFVFRFSLDFRLVFCRFFSSGCLLFNIV